MDHNKKSLLVANGYQEIRTHAGNSLWRRGGEILLPAQAETEADLLLRQPWRDSESCWEEWIDYGVKHEAR